MLQGFCEERSQVLLRGRLSDILPFQVCSFCHLHHRFLSEAIGGLSVSACCRGELVLTPGMCPSTP